MQVCSCNNVSKATICAAIRAGDLGSVADVKQATRAGTGCGACVPLVTDLLHQELKAAGRQVQHQLCEHFACTRQELFQIIKLNRIKAFDALIRSHGRGQGCEICKPAVASLLASAWNEPIFEQATIQDTNDRFMANIQRQGTYSVVPRVPGGEITPEKLIVLGQVAKKYQLYCKITGGQRIDLFGARVDQLPDIWEELIEAGFESGHAYGKAVRTVKSCVGTSWCRYGVQDSVAFAIRVEHRYKGIRAPHKLKSAVSGCLRECAEARSKDFGYIATEEGYNLYVCGNGGTNPRHAKLFATGLSEDEALRLTDRFLMYYIRTADKLTRTADWLEQMDGGLERLKAVIIDDVLGICEQLEQEMTALVGSFQCEWASVVRDPEKRRQFRHFAGSKQADDQLQFVAVRGQRQPAPWPIQASTAEVVSQPELGPTRWVRLASVRDVPRDGGIAVEYGQVQLALFHFAARDAWFVSQNMCPHKRDQVLARGLLGDQTDVPKVACPMHKKTFALTTGECLSGDALRILTFPARVEGEDVLADLPAAQELEAWLATQATACAVQATCNPGCSCVAASC
jgi:nitrite reductase (NADH) large subunit